MSTVVGQTASRRRRESWIGAGAAGVDAFSKTRTTRLIGLAVAVVVGLVGSVATLATPAAAAVPGLIRVSSTSGYSSQDKMMVVACPAGKQLVGTGARIDGGVGAVVITNLSPSGSPTVAPTSVTAQATEIWPGVSQTWSLTVYGICANPLPGLVRIKATSVNNSQDLKAVSAVCPTGKRVVGTGFMVGGGGGEFSRQVSVDAVRFLDLDADPVPTHVSVRAHEIFLNIEADWTLTAYAICATPPAGLRVYPAFVFSDTDDDYGSTVIAACPYHQKVMLGAGFRSQRADSPYPDVFVDNVLDDFTPNGGSTTAPTSVRVTHYEHLPTSVWHTTAYAICVSGASKS
jgi:hypothetical protein